jgi:hypothetical protein
MKNWANELNKAFSKEHVQITKKHMKKWATSLAMQIKITLRFHLLLLEWLSSRTQQMLVRMWENSMEAPQKTKNRTAISSSNTTPRDITEGI